MGVRKFVFKDMDSKEKHCTLFCDIDAKKYWLNIEHGLSFEESTCFESLFIAKGVYELDNHWSYEFVKIRAIPPERQMIGCFLRDLGIDEYDELPFLIRAHGKCCQDRLEMFEETPTEAEVEKYTYKEPPPVLTKEQAEYQAMLEELFKRVDDVQTNLFKGDDNSV